MSSPQQLIASDGLVARSSGEWVKRKHHFFRNYCAIVTKGMKNQRFGLVYVDAMAGPGRCIIRETNEETPGSPVIALEHAFNQYVFAESDPELADALRQRVSQHPRGKPDQVVARDWCDLVKDGKLDFQNSLVIAFVDPTGISQVPWLALERLLRGNSKIDLLMTVQHGMGIKLNAGNYVDTNSEDETALSQFLGENDWRNWRFTSPTDFTDKVLNRWFEKVRQLGFEYIHQELVTAGTLPLYRFVWCSRHSLGADFSKKITRWDEKGQKEFNL